MTGEVVVVPDPAPTSTITITGSTVENIVVVEESGPIGPQGPPGPPGPPGVLPFYVETIGDGFASSYVLHHGLGTRDVAITMYALLAGVDINGDVSRPSVDEVLVSFGQPVPVNAVRVLIAAFLP